MNNKNNMIIHIFGVAMLKYLAMLKHKV